MKTRTILSLAPALGLLAFTLTFVLASPCFAQVATGTPTFGTYSAKPVPPRERKGGDKGLPNASPSGPLSGGPDVINLGNLNAHLVIPIIEKAGRGMAFSYNLDLDTSVWTPVTSNGTTSWRRNTATNWGWTTSMPRGGGFVSFSVKTSSQRCKAGGSSILMYSDYAYHDGTGTPHAFPGTSTVVSGACSNYKTSDTATAFDDSGYTISATGNSITSLTAVDGTIISLGTAATTLQDRNGNQITSTTSSGTTSYYDTLSSTSPVLTVSGSGTPTSPMVYTYTAPGGSASYTAKYTAYTLATNFGVSGISEYGATNINLVSEIDLPDGSKYTFNYEPTPSTPSTGACTPLSGTYANNCVTARPAQVTLPTGGTISYTYYNFTGCTTGNNGVFPDGSASCLQRTTPDGTWRYTRTGSGTAWTTTIQDPPGDQTVIQFQEASGSANFYETQRTVSQLINGTQTLLRTTNTCYNGASSPCTSTAITLPISSITKIIQLPGSSNLECKHVENFNSFGLPTTLFDYDYGNGTPGPLIRSTSIAYAALGNNINAFRQTVTVQDGSGHTASQTSYNYDEASVVPSSGTPQHVSVSGSRGNLTSILYTTQGTSTLKQSFTYFDTGNVQTATDVNNAQTTFNYADATSTCGNAFPTSVTEAISGLSRSMVWNCTGGVETSATDENGKTVSTTYSDANFWRPASATDQLSNQMNLSYSMNPVSVESSLVFNSSSSTADELTTLDGLGRILVTQRKQSPSSTTYDSVETDYDSLGRPSRTTVPYSGTMGQTNGTGPATTQTYDALNRALVTTDGGNGTVTLSYPQNDVLQIVGPAPSGENQKQRQSEYNPLGELTSVCEITGLSGSGTCGQTTSATGYWTKYAYDGAGRLLTVSQNAQSTSQVQTRSYTYDELGRMTSETNPETGTKSYVYDSDSAGKCPGTYNGDLIKKTDAAGNVSCYAYDALHRTTSITYPSGPNSSNTLNKYFVYDSVTVKNCINTAQNCTTFAWITPANGKARLVEAYTATCQTCSKVVDELFSYTARGEVQDVYESTPHSFVSNFGTYFNIDETYWANGAVNQISEISGLPTLTYAPDGEGRAKSVSASSGQNPVTSVGYNLASEPTGLTFGSQDADEFSYDPNTFRMTQYQFVVNGSSDIGRLTWNSDGTLASLNITDAFNAANTQNCAYSYDDLARIASGNCGSVWSQTFSYDAFGNITKAGTNSFNPGYNTATNRMSTGASYDANGDVLTDSLHSYAWDVETRPTTIDSVTVTYDALGRMVEQNKSGTYTEIVYDALGNKLALMNGTSTLKEAFVPLPAGATAVYNASGLQYYRHPDWLGSSRFSSTPTRTMYNDLAFAPFGEIYATSGTTTPTNISFAGNNQDTTTNLYDAYFREYGIQGRWPSPDPAGVAAANPANPQSWNRYAYVLNNPMNWIDPLGLEIISITSGPDAGCTWDTETAALTCPDPWADLYPLLFGGGGGGGGGDGGGGGGGGGSGNGPGPNPNPPKPGCPADPGLAVNSGGAVGGGTLGAGAGSLGGSVASGSVGVVTGAGAPVVGVASGGAMTTAGNYINGAPDQRPLARTYGAYAGVSVSGIFSNGQPGQLRGPFRGFSVEVGLGDFNFGFQFACSGLVCQGTISPPGFGVGVGVLVTTMATNTAVTTKQCK